ncbi:MAG: heme ABC transporter permease [Granulosicoccaceae bacterium]
MNIHKYASAKVFYPLASRVQPWVAGLAFILIAFGLYLGLFVAPPDYQQGESVRIMFIHVPSAWMSMFVYAVLAGSAAIGLIWKIKLSDTFAREAAPIGASFTLLALLTGSLWGKPMWGTWWVWDARLTSELLLLFLYLGFIALQASIEDPRRAARAGAMLALIGVVNLPVIHFSVEWWNTLHQPASVTRLDAPAIHPDILMPLLVMSLGFTVLFFYIMLLRMRAAILEQERHTTWLQELMGKNSEHG